MKTLHSICITNAAPESSGHWDLALVLKGHQTGAPVALVADSADLLRMIASLLNALCDDFVSATIEPAGNIVINANTQRAVFAVTLTLRAADSEHPEATTSEQLPPYVRDAMPDLWAAAEREFSAEKKTNKQE